MSGTHPTKTGFFEKMADLWVDIGTGSHKLSIKLKMTVAAARICLIGLSAYDLYLAGIFWCYHGNISVLEL